jgi:hypothetical protein
MENQAEYDVEKLRVHFLVLLDAEGNRTDLYPIHVAQQFPHILAKLVELWRTPELDDYFEKDLLTTNRPHRQGFPSEVAVELFRLSNFHSSLGLRPTTVTSPWDAGVDINDPKKRGYRG